jgi:type III pantothenate kinase
MKTDVVVDVGNSRMKWGLCRDEQVCQCVSLPLEASELWDKQFQSWELSSSSSWALSGVNPAALAQFGDWLRQRSPHLVVLSSSRDVPITVLVDAPEKVGIDRLLNAVAATARIQRPVPLFIIDAGTAVTVDWVDSSAAFRGGAILPGLGLMAKSLHEHTALLPLLDVSRLSVPGLPGQSTKAAMEAGVFWAVAGGIQAILRQLTDRAAAHRGREVFLTGGNAPLLEPVMSGFMTWPHMTLEGIRLSAEKLT